MKDRFTFTLDPEIVEKAKILLRPTGQSLSGYINALLHELVQFAEDTPTPMSKPIGKMTLDEFGQAMSYWVNKVKEIEGEDGTSSD